MIGNRILCSGAASDQIDRIVRAGIRLDTHGLGHVPRLAGDRAPDYGVYLDPAPLSAFGGNGGGH